MVVRDVSLSVKSGEVAGLLGPNGAGKTTCFYMIVGLVPPDAGQILLNQVDVTRRAIPWTKLLIDRPGTGGDLNLQWKQKLCVALVLLAALALPLSLALEPLRATWAPLWLPLALLAPVLVINRALYALFLARRGPLFAVAGFLLHQLYFFYGGLAYAWVQLTHRRRSA